MKKFAIWMLYGVLCPLMASLALYGCSDSCSYESYTSGYGDDCVQHEGF